MHPHRRRAQQRPVDPLGVRLDDDHDPTAAFGGTPSARGALTFRLFLAGFGFAVGAVVTFLAAQAEMNEIPGAEPLAKPLRPEPVNAWLCRGVTCLEPMSDLVDLKKTLEEKA